MRVLTKASGRGAKTLTVQLGFERCTGTVEVGIRVDDHIKI